MRNSVKGLEHMVDETKHHPGLPDDLRPFEVYYKDVGYCVLCIPEVFREQAKTGDPDMYEVGIPAKYVLTHSRTIENGYVYIDAPYDEEIGIDVDEKYFEF